LLFTGTLYRGELMKVLLAVDGSPASDVVIGIVARRPWPPDTEVKVLSVAHPFPFVPEPVGMGIHFDSLAQERKRATGFVSAAVSKLGEDAPHLRTTSEVAEGSPAKGIIDVAARWRADLIMLGSKGRGAVASFLMGSVSFNVVLHAPCSVEVARVPDYDSDGTREPAAPPSKD
jgi:nucleotide-binding universal stress UspA family protein